MTGQAGRTPREGLQEIRRREQIPDLRRMHRRMSRRHGYWKVLGAAIVSGWIGGWGLMIIVGVLHAWWHFIPSMGAGTAITISDVLLLTAVAIIITVQAARDSS